MMGMGPADNAALRLHYGQRPGQVKLRPQRFRVVGQPIAVGPGLGPQPGLKLGVGNGSHFRHIGIRSLYSPFRGDGMNQL